MSENIFYTFLTGQLTQFFLLSSRFGYLGKPDGHIARHELATLPSELVYACQNKAWFDEPTMLKWINEILVPHVVTAPEGVVPVQKYCELDKGSLTGLLPTWQ